MPETQFPAGVAPTRTRPGPPCASRAITLTHSPDRDFMATYAVALFLERAHVRTHAHAHARRLGCKCLGECDWRCRGGGQPVSFFLGGGKSIQIRIPFADALQGGRAGFVEEEVSRASRHLWGWIKETAYVRPGECGSE